MENSLVNMSAVDKSELERDVVNMLVAPNSSTNYHPLAHVFQPQSPALNNSEINVYKSQNVVIGSVTHIHGQINVNQQIIISGRRENVSSNADLENKINAITLTDVNCEELEEAAANTDDEHNIIPYEYVPTSYLRIVTKSEWFSRPISKAVDYLELPVSYAVISHTATEPCLDRITCLAHMRYIQNMHMDLRKWPDIGYNFVVGGDGAVYEGRGWNIVGNHTLNHNKRSIGIGVIGTFCNVLPSEKQLTAIKRLLEVCAQRNKLTKDYQLYGHRQLRPSESPGDKFFAEIQKWPHFTNQLPDDI